MIRVLAMVAVIHFLWLLFGSSFYTQEVSTNTKKQPESVGSITSVENGSALKSGPVAGP